MNADMCVVGKVLKPRGIRGEVKIQILTNKLNVFTGTGPFVVGDRTFKMNKGAVSGGFAYCFFEGVNDIESAERIRGLVVQVERAALGLDEDEVLAEDLIGFEVTGKDGEKFGKVTSVEDYGAGPIIVTDVCTFPYEDDFVAETDIKARIITVHSEMLTWEEE